jgi:putative ABC transport system permease protein
VRRSQLARTETRVATIPSGRPIWRRAPTALRHSPALWAALALSAFLVSITAASYPLFLSASKSQLLAEQIADPLVSNYGAGITYRSTHAAFTARAPGGGSLIAERAAAFTERTAESPDLEPAQEQILGAPVDVTLPGGRIPPSGPVQGRLFAGTDVLDNVTILAGTDGPGVWLPDLLARGARLRPGDEFELAIHGRHETVTLDGIYRALYTQPRSGYWRTWADDIYAICPGYDCPLPPQPILVDRAQLMDLGTHLGGDEGTLALVAPASADPPLTLDEARDLAGFADRFKADMSAKSTDLFRLFRCCGDVFLHSNCTQFFCPASEVTYASLASDVVGRVDERLISVQGPLLVLLIAGLGISLAIVAAAGVFVLMSRRVEVGVLSVRGWGGSAVGAKAVLEAVLPFFVGGIVGFALASVTIAAVGPPGRIESSARSTAVTAAVIAVAASLLVVGLVSAAVFLSSHDRRHRVTRVLGFVPWELAVFAAAWVMARRLEGGGAIVESGGIERPGSAVFLFPLLLALAIGILAARVMTVALTLGHRRAKGSPGAGPWWLASRRLRTSGRLPQLLLIAGSLTLAVFVSSQGMVHSLRTTVDAKATVFVGSDVQVVVNRDMEPAPGFGFPVTPVVRSRDAGAFTGSTLRYDLLAIDPDTFGSAAFWNDAFSDDSLADLVSRLPSTGGAALPVIMSNGGDYNPSSIDLSDTAVPIEIVGRATSFPGTSTSDRPLLVVDRDALAEHFTDIPDPLNTPMASAEFWVAGPTDEILASLADIGATPYSVLTADEVEDIPFIDAAIQTFLMLDILGIVAMVLLVVVAMIYLQARQRSRVVATELSGRMGQGDGTMRRSLMLELGAVLVGALVVGAVVGAVATRLVAPNLDPLPTIPPDSLIVLPYIGIAIGLLATVIASVAGALLADRSARRVPLGEVLRVAE